MSLQKYKFPKMLRTLNWKDDLTLNQVELIMHKTLAWYRGFRGSRLVLEMAEEWDKIPRLVSTSKNKDQKSGP